jgi:hypothetical protein
VSETYVSNFYLHICPSQIWLLQGIRYLYGYTGKRNISFTMQTASTYLTCNIIPQWFKVGQPCTMHYCVQISSNMYILFLFRPVENPAVDVLCIEVWYVLPSFQSLHLIRSIFAKYKAAVCGYSLVHTDFTCFGLSLN